jgi:hypothetical protein
MAAPFERILMTWCISPHAPITEAAKHAEQTGA